MAEFGIRYWWRVRRVLLFPQTSAGLSAMLGVSGFLIAALSVSYSYLSPASWFIGGIVFAAGVVYFSDYGIRRAVMRQSPIFEKSILPEDFINAPPELTPEYRFVAPAGANESQLYPYVDLCHHSPHIQAENDLTRAGRAELYQRWHRLCPDAFLHLEKRVDGVWRPIAATIILPLSATGFTAITRGRNNRQISVIELDRSEILERLGTGKRVLLIDTWVIDRSYGGAGHGKTSASGGFGNSLVLRQVARFWNPARGRAEVTFLVETSNRYLEQMLLGFRFRRTGRSRIDEDFYETDRSTLRGLMPAEYRSLAATISALAQAPVVVGTAPRPGDWSRSLTG